ncbi:MAG: PAS domain S-box protein [Thermoanaerobaculaceae bacterium]|nr:PAS domain S-box protein [Thermoanaerobaculaceae bacterium]
MSRARPGVHKRREDRERRPTGAFALIVGIGGALVAGALYFLFVYAPAERAQVVGAWEARLDAMADDRKAAILSWVASGISDATTVANFPTVVAVTAAHAGRAEAASADAAAHLQGVIDVFTRAHRHRAIYVLDAAGAMLASNSGESASGGECPAVVRRLAMAGKPFADFCGGPEGMPLVVFGAPITEPASATGGRPATLGAAIVATDPTAWLYPLLAREPLPTESGEVLLVRRDGDRVVFVSPLRHRAAQPLTHALRADVPALAARAAVDGQETFGTYLDYRGVPVFAATRKIDGTPWGLVAKIDREEALVAYRKEVRSSALTMVGFALALVATGFGLWRARRARYEAALSRSQARFALLVDHANDPILFVGTDGRILDANRKAETLYGYSREELLRLTIRDLRAEEARGNLQDQMTRASLPDGHVFQTRHLRKDGSTFPVEVSSRLAELDEGRAVLSIVRDLSEREAAEERIRFLNRLLRAITEINELMVRERNTDRILTQTCRIAVEHGRFRMAWVGLADFKTGEVRPVASAGFEEGYLQEVRIRCDDSPEGRGPTGTAIREGRAVVVNDWDAAASVDPWRDAGRKRFFRSTAAFPIAVDGQARGAFSVYSEERDVFAPEIVSLLDELAQDLGFALQVAEGEERRARAENALRESEERFRTLIEKSADLLVVLDRRETITFAGPSSIDVLGFPPEELVGAGVFAFVHPDDVVRVRKLFRELREQPGAIGRVELRGRHRNGSWRVLDAVQRSLFHVPGVNGMVVNARDITERKQVEAAVRESEERYRRLVDTMQDVVFTLSMTGTLTSLNAAFERITGWSCSEWVGRPFADLVHPDDLNYALDNFARVLDQRSPGLFELRIKARDGSWLDGEFSGVQLLENGGVVGALGTVRDVTQRRRETEERKRLAAAVEQAAEAIMVTDVEGTIEYVNPAFERISGYAAGEVLGANPRILKSGKHDEGFYREMWETLWRGEVWSGRFVNRCRDGSLIEEDATISPVRDPSGRVAHFVAVKRDVTQEALLEQQLRQVQRLEAIGRLAGGVAHDFNNLLQAMLSQTQIIHNNPDDPRRVADTVDELEQQIRRGAALSRQLLLFSRRETAKPERLDLSEVVGGATQLLRRLVRENIAFAVELADEPLPVIADRGQIDQVLMNLVVNASDAMPEGGRLVVRTGVGEGGTAWLSVEDTGQGVPEGIRDRIFEPFFTTKGADKGSGLGLAVVHGIVTQHDGTIRVSDREGGGTVFRIELPKASTGEALVQAASRVEADDLPRGRGERVLVVEDETGAREGLVDVLTMLGYEVAAVGSAEEARRLPQESAFDVLLSDLLLPDVSGAELARGLLECWPRLKVILMSGYTEDEAVRRGVGAGTLRFLQKPFDMRTLAREIRTAIAEGTSAE